MDRFFCPNFAAGAVVELEDLEAHHLQHVLRGKVGDRVELFDGRGQAVSAEVVRLARHCVTLQVQGDIQRQAAPAIELTLAVASPKGERLKWLVEKATELGVARLVPLNTERSVTEPRDSRLAKLEQTVIAACKQSGRNTLLEISPLATLADVLQRDTSAVRWIAHPGKSSVPGAAVRGSDAICLIGPEGGFSDSEVEQAMRKGFTRVALGPLLLRVETAAIAVAAQLLADPRRA